MRLLYLGFSILSSAFLGFPRYFKEIKMYEIFAKLLADKGLRAADVTRATGIKSPVFSEWKKGKSRPNADKMLLIANFLGVSVEYLMTGKEPESALNKKDEKDIEKILNQTREQLLSQEGLMFDGDPASPEAIDSILSAMQIGMEMAKKKNKEKYTPKKYKKD